MYTYRDLLYLLGAASTTITLGSCCYHHGYSFKDLRGRVIDEAITNFCESWVPGNFVKSQKIEVCYGFPPDNSGNRIDMAIINKAEGSQGMSKEACKEKLISLYNVCERGGEGEIDSFLWRVDPNSGGCP